MWQRLCARPRGRKQGRVVAGGLLAAEAQLVHAVASAVRICHSGELHNNTGSHQHGVASEGEERRGEERRVRVRARMAGRGCASTTGHEGRGGGDELKAAGY